MASKENQEALDTLGHISKDGMTLAKDLFSNEFNTLQQAIDRLDEDEEIIEHLCNDNEKLVEEEVNFEMALELLIKDYLKDHTLLNLSLSVEQVKQLYLEKVKELENGK